jgi:hypothetical protein
MKLSFNFNQIINWIKFFVFHIFIIGICFLAACISFLGLFCVHEFGHKISGSIGNLIRYGEPGQFQFDRFMYIGLPLPGNNSVLLPFSVPTQTIILTLNPGDLWMAFGGVVAVSCIALILGYCLYKFATRIEKVIIVLLTAVIIIAQIISNCICGTDNFIQTPFFAQPVCNSIVDIFRILVLMALFVYFVIIVKTLLKRNYKKD